MPTFFEDPGLLKTVRSEIVPRLRTFPSIRIWVPECGSGAEDAFSLAILFREERLSRAVIYATDSDGEALEHARSGTLSAAPLSPANYAAAGGRASIEEYFVEEGHVVKVRPALLSTIVFAGHDLSTDASFNEFQFVLCRSGVSALDERVRRRAMGIIDESLCRSGCLGVADPGIVDLCPDPHAYERFPGEPRLFKKLR